eukprot:CAMPEP_0119367610 /NCGR_PEP_ID=MMETSP1334-20130426/14384_1 /TAXON_ID=127549 /ORGANISM="Calcidiscus leptoporus, Strain RCC1130" /LENGTH=197 /DNA_ID=CAMNT_0007384055 /DNA_START=12 /DNA_END=605 /DNA_ORIENTATION=-
MGAEMARAVRIRLGALLASTLLLAPASALRLAVAPALMTRAASRITMVAGKLPPEALVPRGTVSKNLFQNLKQMQDQRVARASHLLLAPGKCTLPIAEAKALMESWKREIGDDAEKFAEKARIASHCPTAAKGGDLGYLVRSSCSETFNQVLFEQPPGSVYGPIVTPAGLHLIYVASCQEPRPNAEHAKARMPWDRN